jgi:hypothetical protein
VILATGKLEVTSNGQTIGAAQFRLGDTTSEVTTQAVALATSGWRPRVAPATPARSCEVAKQG